MKKLISAALLMMASTTMVADELGYLTIGFTDTEESISLPTINKIYFSEGHCIVQTTDGTFSYPIEDMKRMTFTSEPTAIQALPEKEEGMEYAGGILKLQGNGMLRVYNAGGKLVQMANVKEGANVDMGNLPKGLYIISLGDKTIKMMK